MAETIDLGKDGGGGLLTLPQGGGQGLSAVVLLPAIAGRNDYIQRVGDQVAAQGSAVLTIDYYRRTGAAPDLSDMPKILAAVAALPDRQVVDDVRDAVDVLRARPEVDGDRIGVLGFCIGGTLAILSACDVEGLACAVAFYGILRYDERTDNKPESPLEASSRLGCPLLGHFGEADHLVPVADVHAMRERLNGKPAELYTYPGAGHAFHEDFRPPVYRPVAATTAWERTRTYLDWYLRAGSASTAS
jgi:carboxymethylenebutenolidase